MIKLEKSNFFDIILLVWIIYMKKELTEDEKQITKKVVDGLTNALTDKINDRNVYMKGIDTSYKYEEYSAYTMNELDK